MNAQETLASLPIRAPEMALSRSRQQKTSTWEITPNLQFYFFLIGTIDLLLLNASIMVELAMKVPFANLSGANFQTFFLFMLLVNVTAIAVASFTDVFRVFEGVKLSLKIKDLFLGTIIYFGVISFIYYQFFFTVFEAHFLFTAFCSFLISASIVHAAFRLFKRNVSEKILYAVIGGESARIQDLNRTLESVYGTTSVCVGRFGTDALPDFNHLGAYQEIKRFLRFDKSINKLLYLESDLSARELQKISRLCRSNFVNFEVIPKEISFFEKGVQLEQMGQLPILRRKMEPLCLLKNKVLKRVFDVVFSLAVILLVFPWLFPLIALAIRLESRGPVFFKQKRSGYWNKPFNCLKFRSMRVNDECDSKQAVRSDCRITVVGAFLRKTSLDELPQFFNVLRGDMSVVGPRPHMLKHTEDYSQLIETFMIRHQVKPGITGWAQVNGWRGPTQEIYQMAKRVEFDVHYIENWSFWFDCRCILLTINKIFAGENNAF